MKTTMIALSKKAKNIVKKVFYGEKRKHYGKDNPDKTFYVINSASTKLGLYAYVLTFSGRINEAIQKGYIPVIDLQNRKNTYLEDSEVGKVNAWEFYFEQPGGVSLDDIRTSKNVIIGSGEPPKEYPMKSMEFLTDQSKITYWHELFTKYIRLNAASKEYVETCYNNIFPHDGERVCGVLARGTDYIMLRPYQHPIQPEPDEIIRKTKEVMEQEHCEYVYLATEDNKIYEMFKAVFGDKLLSMNVQRFASTDNKLISDVIKEKKYDRRQQGMEYLTTIELLARCNCLVAGRAGGSVAAMVLAGGYEYAYFYDLGLYGIDDLK